MTVPAHNGVLSDLNFFLGSPIQQEHTPKEYGQGNDNQGPVSLGIAPPLISDDGQILDLLLSQSENSEMMVEIVEF